MTQRRLRISALLIVPVVAALGAVAVSGSAGARRAQTAAGKGFKARLSYTETNHGHGRGSSTVGLQGKGSFSATLGKNATLEAAFIALATGVPIAKIAQGGKYVVEWTLAADGGVSGLLVAKLAAHGLGTSCVSYSYKHGKFRPGMTFVPTTGALKTVGGTGAAATWRINATFKLTGTSGPQFDSAGSEQASTGKSRPLSAACKHVAAIH